MLFEGMTALTCRYVPHALPELPWSVTSSWTSSTTGLPERDTSPSVSEVRGRGCVKPLVFMLVLLSSMKPHCTKSAQASASCYTSQMAVIAKICGYSWHTINVHVRVAAQSFPVPVHTVFSSQRIWWPRSHSFVAHRASGCSSVDSKANICYANQMATKSGTQCLLPYRQSIGSDGGSFETAVYYDCIVVPVVSDPCALQPITPAAVLRLHQVYCRGSQAVS